MSKRLGYDAPKLSADEATELCVHYLRHAAALFQIVPDDNNEAIIEEIIRTCDDIDGPAARAFCEQMLGVYEKMKDQD